MRKGRAGRDGALRRAGGFAAAFLAGARPLDALVLRERPAALREAAEREDLPPDVDVRVAMVARLRDSHA
ncbi:hypothetical protein JCM9957A_05180 [Kineosporia succinea]